MTSAETIAHALRGHRSGDGFLCQCPVPAHGKGHGDRRPSLLVKDGETAVLVKCFAGCEPRDILDTLRDRGLLELVHHGDGWRTHRHRRIGQVDPSPDHQAHSAEDAARREKRMQWARRVWARSKPLEGTAAERYLASRGLQGPYPSTLRFVPLFQHRIFGGGWPAMVAAVHKGNELVAVHITALSQERPAKAEVSQSRIIIGPAAGGAIRLGEPQESLILAEGIETAFSAQQEIGRPAWAAISASMMKRVELPPLPLAQRIYIAADGDGAGIDARQCTGQQCQATRPCGPRRGGAQRQRLERRITGTDEMSEAVMSIKESFENAEPLKPSLRDRVAELAAMDPLDYVEIRKAVKKEYDIPASELDRAVKKARGDNGDLAQGEAFTIEPPEPWPEPVDGDALADELRGQIMRYIWLPDGAAAIVTLWILHTYVFGAWRISPRLFITSPVKGCGKTTLLNSIIGRTVYKPLLASNVAAAVLFRSIARWRPTLVIDEVDSFMKQDEDLRGIVNSSHTIDGGVLRCVGDDYEVRRFSTWAPMAFAGIGRVTETIEDRSIVIQIQRRTAAESIADIDGAAFARFEEWTRKAVRWADGMEQTLADYRPDIPDGMTNRLADNWRPILAMADAVGGDWPRMAREAAKAYHVAQEETSAGVLALLDIAELFEARQTDKLASTTIVSHLVEMDDRPWPEWRHGKPITTAALGRLLKRFHIASERLRDSPAGAQYRGYKRAPIVENAARYGPKSGEQGGCPPLKVSKCHNVNETNGLERIQSVTEKKSCDTLKSEKPQISANCDTVTLQNSLSRDFSEKAPDAEGLRDAWRYKT